MTWSEKRKLSYISIVFLVLASITFYVIHKTVSVPPTCYDNKRNGSEVGVDCGGVCTFYCKNELVEPKVRWVRSFEVTPGVVHAIAYIEHSYPAAAAQNVQYQFKLYDENNTIVAERSGTTFLGPMGQSAIVETLIPVQKAKVALTRFAFTPPVPWEKIPASYSQIVIKTDRYTVEPFDGGTRLVSVLENMTRYEFTNLDIVAILYDANGNAITTSKVLLPELASEGTTTVYFTWPFAIRTPVARVDIVPRFNPFTAKEL